jgi:hypothetical protein
MRSLKCRQEVAGKSAFRRLRAANVNGRVHILFVVAYSDHPQPGDTTRPCAWYTSPEVGERDMVGIDDLFPQYHNHEPDVQVSLIDGKHGNMQCPGQRDRHIADQAGAVRVTGSGNV